MISLELQTILQFLSQLDEVSHDDFTRNNQEIMKKKNYNKSYIRIHKLIMHQSQ